ncbi:hypothetical protein ACUSIJ_13395 [Pseudochelatococcus sp. B33]
MSDDNDLSEEAVAQREASQRKLAAKRNNERVKLRANSMNAVALGIFGAAFVVPGVSNSWTGSSPAIVIWILFAFALHIGANWMFQFMRSED